MTSQPQADPAETTQWYDLTLSMDELMKLVPRWTMYTAICTFVPYFALWGLPSFSAPERLPALLLAILLYTAVFLLVYAVSAVVHEGLHAAAMVLVARVPPRTIRFHMRLREGIAYVHTGVPMSARAYRVVLALPGAVQGVLPALVGLAVGSGWLVFYGFVMLASSLGDGAMLRLMRGLPGSAQVRDHPSRVGCQVRYDA